MDTPPSPKTGNGKAASPSSTDGTAISVAANAAEIVLGKGLQLGNGFRAKLDVFGASKVTPTLSYDGFKDKDIALSFNHRGITELSKGLTTENTRYEIGVLGAQNNSGIVNNNKGLFIPNLDAPVIRENYGSGLGVKRRNMEKSTDSNGSTVYVETTIQIAGNAPGIDPQTQQSPTTKFSYNVLGRDYAYNASVYEHKNKPAASLTAVDLTRRGDVNYHTSGVLKLEEGNNMAQGTLQLSSPLKISDSTYGYIAGRATADKDGIKKEGVFGIAQSLGSSMMHFFVQGHIGNGKPRVEAGIEIGGQGIAKKLPHH